MNNSTYFDTVPSSEQLFSTAFNSNCSPKRENSVNDASMFSWPITNNTHKNSNDESMNLPNVLGPTDVEMTNLIWQVDSSSLQRSNSELSNSLMSTFDNLFEPWDNNMEVPPTIKEEWGTTNDIRIKQEPLPYQQEEQKPFKLPLTPPFDTSHSCKSNNRFRHSFDFSVEPMPTSCTAPNFNEFYSNSILQQVSREVTPPPSATVSSFASGSNSPHSNISTPSPMSQYFPQISQQHLINHMASNTMVNSMSTRTKGRGAARRKSADGHLSTTRTYRRRASSHPSVASVVSLSAHEPVSRIIDGVEHITFLYSRDRLVKEYTVRTDIENVNLDDIPVDFRVPNAVSPRVICLQVKQTKTLQLLDISKS